MRTEASSSNRNPLRTSQINDDIELGRQGPDQKYESGQRQWLKVKHRDVLDVVCAAVIGSRTQPTAVVAGLPSGGDCALSAAPPVLSAKTARELGKHLRPPAQDHPWPEEISHGVLNKFSREKGPVHLALVEPVVVEVSADVAWSGRSFRHPLRLLRARPDLPPGKVRPSAHLSL